MPRLHGFQKKELLDIYHKMVLSRKLDEKMMIMIRQGKAFFLTACAGHESAQLAAASVMQPGKDWAYTYYRDSAFALGLGTTSRDHLLSFLSRKNDPDSGGRQFPYHFSRKDLRIVTPSSATGMQFLHAVGTGLAIHRKKSKEIVYVSSGEGTTSQGDFHEALNWSSREKLPVIFHIQDNEYAISVHVSEQTAGGSTYAMVAGYKNLARFDVDGTDFFETNLAFKKAADRARKGKGPSVIVSHVVRLLPHSSSDDQRKYRSEKELDELEKNDPIIKFESACLAAKILTEQTIETTHKLIKEQVDVDAAWAEGEDHPDPSTALDHLYADDPPLKETELNTISEKIVLVDAINHALDEEMERNPKMVIFGQDVADPKGGVFTATKGLSTKFGLNRVFNSQLAESSIAGAAVGMAVAGFKPVVEIQFGDYIWTAMMHLKDEISMIRYRSAGEWSCPIVIRVPVGGYIHGGPYHSQSIDGLFLKLHGIRIAYPSNAADAKGLLKAACKMNDPVLFFEHKGLYRQGYSATPEPDENYILPFGKAKIVRPGEEITIITWGAMVQKSIEAVKSSGLNNGEVEIIDLRTLNPIDMEAIQKTVQKTGKVLIVHEDTMTGGPGAEIAARIVNELFEYLDGPIARVAAKDCHIPYSWVLEEQILPQTADIESALTDLLEY